MCRSLLFKVCCIALFCRLVFATLFLQLMSGFLSISHQVSNDFIWNISWSSRPCFDFNCSNNLPFTGSVSLLVDNVLSYHKDLKLIGVSWNHNRWTVMYPDVFHWLLCFCVWSSADECESLCSTSGRQNDKLHVSSAVKVPTVKRLSFLKKNSLARQSLGLGLVSRCSVCKL